jgi:hypothetical protein
MAGRITSVRCEARPKNERAAFCEAVTVPHKSGILGGGSKPKTAKFFVTSENQWVTPEGDFLGSIISH